MSKFRVTLRNALADSIPVTAASLTLEALPEGHVIHVLGVVGNDLSEKLAELSDGQPHAVRTFGPGQWLLVGDRQKSNDELAALLEALQPDAFGADQSQGRIRIQVRGNRVENVLSKGTAIDLSLQGFPVGSTATTLIGHVSAHLTRVGTHAFEIIVLRSFAESLWDELARMSAEFA